MSNIAKSKLPKSVRKFIRLEKSRIRGGVLDSKKEREMVDELYKKFLNKTADVEPEVKKEEKPVVPEKAPKNKVKKAVKTKKAVKKS